jgi:hypothetical protein
MGQRYGTAVFFRHGQWSAEHVCGVLFPILQQDDAEPRWTMEARPPGDIFIPDPSTKLDAFGRWLERPALGHDAITLSPSASGVVRGNYEGLEIVDEYLRTALLRLDPVFGYFSIFEDLASREHIDKVMAQLHDGRLAELDVTHARVLLSIDVRIAVVWRSSWTVIDETLDGLLVKTPAFDD